MRSASSGRAPLGIPLVIAGFITLWRDPQLRFLGVTATLIVIYVLVWIPGKVYYPDGILPAILAAGSVPAERWIATARRPRARRAAIGVLALAGTVVIVPSALPLLPVASLHKVSGAASIADGIGWPQLTLVRRAARPSAWPHHPAPGVLRRTAP
jgi:hypothetical protein